MTDNNADFTYVRDFLLANAEKDYQNFSAGLVPGCDNMLGVRIPSLRQLARQISKQDFRAFLSNNPAEYFEEIMLQGMVLANAKMPMSERLQWLEKFLPQITNWSICDCTTTTFNLKKQEEAQQMYAFLLQNTNNPLPFARRFVLVMPLAHYLQPAYLSDICRLLEEIPGGEYYVDMGKAWLLSTLFVKYREEGLAYLHQSRLDDFTYNKSLQKILESRRMQPEDRELIRSLKRK